MQRADHDKVHAPHLHLWLKVSDSAPKVRRAVADAGRWATICRRAAVTLLAVLASASHAQVVSSVDPSGPKLYWPWQFGPEPYELFGSEKKKLVSAAKGAVSPSASLYNVDAYYRDSSNKKDIVAEFLFGPYERRDTTFLMDALRCKRDKFKRWSCDPKETWTYFRVHGLDSLVSFGNGVSLETAKLITAFEDSSCSLATWRAGKRTDREDILSAPRIYLAKEAGNYVRDLEKAGSCFHNIWVKDGKIDRTESWGILR